MTKTTRRRRDRHSKAPRAGAATAVALVLALAPGVAPSQAEEALAPPDFSGSWELNEERSDDPGERVDEAMRGWAGRPAPGGSRGRSPRAGEPVDERRAVREQMEALVAGPRVITITHAEPLLKIASALPDSPFEQTVYTDGRVFTRRGARGEPTEATARWQRGGRLVVEHTSSSGRAVRETWELVAEGSRVLVSTELLAKGLLPAVRAQRVYDRVEIVPWD